MSKPGKKRKKFKRQFFIWSFILVLIVSIIGILANSIFFVNGNYNSNSSLNSSNIENSTSKEFEKATHRDTTDDFITLSEPILGYDENAGDSLKYRFTGRRINIVITGLDSRIGTNYNHADANHIISILVDSGKVEIISIPRDTPADAGFHDSTGQNKITVVRAVRGREAYHQELIKIAQIDKIHYFIEVGFSQVIGILDIFGFRDAKSTLQVLRSRKGLGGDDYQRCYNQAQFIRQMILHHFKDIKSGLLSELFIRGALALVSTNLSYHKAKEVISMLESKNFPYSTDDIRIKIRPPINAKFKVYNLISEEVIENLKNKIEQFNKAHNETDTVKVDVYNILKSQLARVEPDTLRAPRKVISALKTYYEQRAWLQIEDEPKREEIRRRFENCLSSAFTKLNQFQKAQEVQQYFQLERALFKSMTNR